MRVSELHESEWPPERLPEGVASLCEKAGLTDRQSTASHADTGLNAEAGASIGWMAESLGCEAHQVHTNMRDVGQELCRSSPAILRLPDGSFVLLVAANGRRLSVLGPDLRIRHVSLYEVVRILREPHVAALQETFGAFLVSAEIKSSHRERALEMLCEDQLATRRFTDCWSLRPNPGESAARWLNRSRAYHLGAGLFSAHTAQYLLWLASWAIVGTLSLEGRMDRGWLAAWALLLLTLVPFRVLTTWLQGVLAIRIGASLKRRLLLGALRLRPDEMRHEGMGAFLGQIFEAEAVESLALTGGIGGLLAVIEIVVSGFVLGRLAVLLLAWCAVTIFATWRFVVRYQSWTNTRMHMTQDLVERMVGHRTRLAQESRSHWHEDEDEMLSAYLRASRRVDKTGTWLVTAVTRGWLLAGLACLAPSVTGTKTAASSVAVALGGVLLAHSGLKRLTASLLDVIGAWISWKRIAFLFKAAAGTPVLGSGPVTSFAASTAPLIEAERLVYRYRPESRAAVHGLTIAIHSGDRVLLEGPSGGGKTTFASLLSGVREPNAGLLLIHGLDRHTLGTARWRKAIASAPQFHENHILTETLAFNLLMGRRWPPLQSDVEEAEALCRELGLGDLLDRMPGGMLQMVGEGGWQLSHGERSRVYIARALLQQADLVILDESFAALDPESLSVALECTLKHAKSLMVIAHP